MPVATTIQHVATMVGRWLSFFRECGPALVDGFTLLGGYTETVDTGDGEFVTVDTTAMCAEFTQIAAGSTTTSADPTTKEGWDQKIQATTLFVDAAPAEWQDTAQTYLGIVEDPEVLLAEYGYPPITDLPSDIRSAFIADHTAAQAEANTFIAFAKDACGVA